MLWSEVFRRRAVSESSRLPQLAFACMDSAIQLQADLRGPARSCLPRGPFFFAKGSNKYIYIFFLFLPYDLIKLLLEDGFKNPARTCSKVEVSDARSDIFPIS